MKKFDLLFVSLFPLIIFSLIMILKINISYLSSLFLILGVPIFYLSWKNKPKLKKISIFTVIASVPLAIIIELIAMQDNAWYVPTSFFPFRFLGNIPVEDFIWMFFVTAIILLFYEHFVNKKTDEKYSIKGLKFLIFLSYPLLFFIIFLFLFYPRLLNVPYAFFWTGLVLILLPTVLYLYNFKEDLFDFLKTSLYAFYIFFIFELVGVSLNHWVFSGNNYLGWINIFGIRFPFEEFFYVMVLGGFAALSYYNFFINRYQKE